MRARRITIKNKGVNIGRWKFVGSVSQNTPSPSIDPFIFLKAYLQQCAGYWTESTVLLESVHDLA